MLQAAGQSRPVLPAAARAAAAADAIAHPTQSAIAEPPTPAPSSDFCLRGKASPTAMNAVAHHYGPCLRLPASKSQMPPTERASLLQSPHLPKPSAPQNQGRFFTGRAATDLLAGSFLSPAALPLGFISPTVRRSVPGTHARTHPPASASFLPPAVRAPLLRSPHHTRRTICHPPP